MLNFYNLFVPDYSSTIIYVIKTVFYGRIQLNKNINVKS